MPVDPQTVREVAARAGLDLPEDQVAAAAAELEHLLAWAASLPDLPPPADDDLAPRRRADLPVVGDAGAVLDQAAERDGDLVVVAPLRDEPT